MKKSVGATLLAMLALIAGCTHPNSHTLPGQVATGSDGYTVRAEFDSVQNLVPNSEVQHEDVIIGTVTKIDVDGWNALVTMRLLTDQKLPANAQFVIGQKTLLGAQFIDVVTPAAPSGTLAHGDRLSLTSTSAYAETEQVLSAVSLLLNNGGLSQVRDITSELNKTFDDRVPQTRKVVRRLDALLETLDANKAQLVTALEGLDGLSATVARDGTKVSRAIETIGPGLSSLESQRVELVDAVSALGRFSATANQLVNTSSETLLSNLGALRPILEELDRAGNDLPKSLDLLLTVPFPVASTDQVVKGDFANLFLTLDLSPSALSSSFVGSGGLPLQSVDPLAGPLGLDPVIPSTQAPATSSSGGAPPPGAGHEEATSPRPSSTPSSGCNLLQMLLGGCS